MIITAYFYTEPIVISFVQIVVFGVTFVVVKGSSGGGRQLSCGLVVVNDFSGGLVVVDDLSGGLVVVDDCSGGLVVVDDVEGVLL